MFNWGKALKTFFILLSIAVAGMILTVLIIWLKQTFHDYVSLGILVMVVCAAVAVLDAYLDDEW